MGLLNLMKGVYRRMFPIKDIAHAIGLKPIISSDMQDKIDVWYKSYIGKAEWVDGDASTVDRP